MIISGPIVIFGLITAAASIRVAHQEYNNESEEAVLFEEELREVDLTDADFFVEENDFDNEINKEDLDNE